MRVLFALPFSIFMIPIVTAGQAVDLPLPELYAGGPEAPVILSTDMPSPDAWYPPKDAAFHWTLPAGVTAVAADIVAAPGTEPMTSYRPPIESLAVSADQWQEGENYVAVQFRNEEKWGMYSERRVLIDATPPEPFSVDVAGSGGRSESGVVVSFRAVDSLSGLSHYVVEVGDLRERVTPAVAAAGLFVPIGQGRTATIRATAYDLAGNTREAQVTVSPMVPAPAAGAGLIDLEPASVLAAVMGALLIAIFGYMVFERQRYAAALRSLRKESEEVQDQILKVFNALRMEIYDQINAIDGKTRLSKKEKEAVAGLTKALEVSEKLLKKEVKDIRKILG